MWIYIPDVDEQNEAWVGTISPPEGPKSGGSFELIRHVELRDLYLTSPFERRGPVIGLLDHQRRCTLIRPLVHHIDPGLLGVRTGFQRTRIKGSFQALLTDLSVKDNDEKIFSGIAFESEAFGAWYAPPAYSTDFNTDTRTHVVEIKETERKEFDLSTLGRVTCTSGANVSSGIRSGVIKSVSLFGLDFSAPMSLNDVIVTCSGLDRLFGFLIGFRGRPPVFNVWLKKTYTYGDHELPLDGTLNLGGIDWNEGDAPHPMECVHLNGMGAATLQTILEKFIPNQDDIVTRIHAVEFNRLFSNNLNDRFAVLMPILESYITAKYTKDDERTYIDSEKKFFDWVESAQHNDIREFCRKHVEVRDKKSPSLTTLLSRAIDSINAHGFCFPISMAERLKKRRGRMFHSAPQMSEQDVREFFDEIRAATGLLMLHTYLDLGIDISSLAGRYSALSDLRGFLVRPSEDGETPHRQEAVAAGT